MADILDGLNQQQKDAVTITDGPLLIIAGAGTGKTTVITRRIAYLIEQKLAKPHEILALTFTEKAAAEMEERVDVLVPYGYIDTWISTFHAFGDRVLREKALDIGLPPDFQVLSHAQQVLFFQQNLFAFDLNYYRPLANPTKHIEAILGFISRCKDEDISPDDYAKYVESLKKGPLDSEAEQEIARQEELAKAYDQFERLKTNAGKIDYGDQVLKTLNLFREHPKILKEYQDRFKYLLVDEYQDTNYAQNELVKILASDHRNIAVVGDDDQCLPPDTLISIPEGAIEIEKLKEGDSVLTAVGKGSVGVSKVTKVFTNKKNARFLTIKTKSGRKLVLTDNHKVFCYVPKSIEVGQHHYVYLMFRQNLGWRIGVTKDLRTRLSLERSADKIVGIKEFKTDQEARYYEMYWALKYGIPPVVFKERNNVIKGEVLLKLFKDLDSQKGAENLAKVLGIDLSSPHFTLGAVTRGSSRRIKINLNICSRNYQSKRKGLLKNPLISHSLTIQTTNGEIVKVLQESGYTLNKAKKGFTLRIQNEDLVSLGKTAAKLAIITNGFIEAKFFAGSLNVQSRPALVMPAGNLLIGHFLPIFKDNRIYYDEIVSINDQRKESVVYDLEIDRTHNFIADGVVVHNSIYKFRGAAISNILGFKKTFPKAREVVLTENYRSTQKLLDSSYRLIRFNDPDRLEVQNKIDKKLVSGRKLEGEIPTLITAPTLSEEADLVAAEIEKLVKDGLLYKDVAILVRANSQADPFLRSLNIKDIPHKFVGFSGLYSQSEVKTLISLLTAISNFDDSLNLYNLASSEIYNLPLADCIACMDYAKKRSKTLHWVFNNFEKIDDLELSDEGKTIIRQINENVEALIELSRRENVGKVLYEFLNSTGYLQRLEKEEEGAGKIQNIAKFFDKVKEFIDQAQNETVRAFIDYLEIMRTAGDDPATAAFDPDVDAVNVMTVHASKGLEFKAVFMVGLAADRFPSRERSEPIPLPDELIKELLPQGDFHLQEERRLFYVGSTRAQDKLYYTWSRDAGGKRMKKASPFLLEALDRPEIEVSSLPTSFRERIEQFAGRPVPKRETKKVDLITLSQSSIDDYETCAYKYRYSNVLRVPILRSHNVVYGSALHATVARFYQERLAGRKVALPAILEVLENSWVSEGFLTPEHEERRLIQAKEVIKSFWEREKDSLTLPSAVEKEFRFNLTSGGLKILVRGRYDRIDESADKVSIIDFKSTEGRSQEELEKNAKESVQLKVYTLAFYKNDEQKRVPDFVGIYDLDTGLVGGYSPKKDQIEKTEEEIIEVAKNIQENLEEDNFPANPKYFGRQPACNYCAYNSICPFSLAK